MRTLGSLSLAAGALALGLAAASPASASLIYLGTYTYAPGGNPTLTNVDTAIDAYNALHSSSLEHPDDFIGKLNKPASGTALTESDTSGSFIGTLDGTCAATGCKSGTWHFDATDINWVVSYLAVKAGAQFALYDVDPDADSGTWNTDDLWVGTTHPNHPALSHLALFGDRTVPTDVSEPASLALLGSGLLGFAMFRRRRSGKA